MSVWNKCIFQLQLFGFLSVNGVTISVICLLKRLEAGELKLIQNHLKTKPGMPLDRPEQ